ncbi:MAG: ABC transporter ATP-binding protein/permease [Lachnospiraceae bacterium]|nr:ABC transporter ATP-binding protein/permease [Lachnospiraceae bacterium]
MKKRNSKLNKEILKKVLRYMKKSVPKLVLSLLLAGGFVVLTLYIPILTGQLIDLLIDPGDMSLLSTSANIITKIIICLAGAALCQWTMTLLNNNVSYNVVSDIRDDVFYKFSRLPIAYFDAHPHGDILSRLTNDVEQLSDGLIAGFSKLFTGVLTIGITLVFMARLNPLITVVVVVVTPVSLFVSSFIARHTHDMFKEQSGIKGEQTALINEMMYSRRAVSAYNMQAPINEKFRAINNRLEKCSLKATFYSSLVNPCTRFVNSLVYSGVGIFGAISAIKGGISVGELSVFLAYASQYTKPFNEISMVITELQNALACAGRVFEFIDEKELDDAENGKSGAKTEEYKPVISFKNVAFSYVPDRPLITDFSLDVFEGQRVAIVGPTGCGKTTMINLLMHFYEVNKGQICLNGTDIKEISRKELRNNIGMVLQDTWLRNATIRENIALNRPDATEEEIIEAAKAAYAHSFIKRLPKGYDTMISENGDGLSAGQRQLICIARVMLKTPPVLILDEATSSIDTRTEIKIQKAFNHMMQGRTSFIVAHRLSTIMEADRIIVMKDGDIKETGTHQELMAAGGFYRELFNSQF